MKNFLVRTLSGIIFGVIMIVCFLWNTQSYSTIMAVIIAAMMNEFLNISIGKRYPIQKGLAILSGISFFLLLLVSVKYGITPAILLFSLIPVLAIFIANLYIKEFNIHKSDVGKDGEVIRMNNGFEFIPFAVTSILYIAVPMSLCNLIVLQAPENGMASFAQPMEYSGTILLGMIILLWANDVGAYCLGTAIGQKYGSKLFPSISPKKSWVGFWGGLCCTILAAIAIRNILFVQISIIGTIGLAIIICIFGVWGDLIESQFKRNFGVKDSGNIMPGHGGMLDRFDGALLAFPAAVIYLYFFILN